MKKNIGIFYRSSGAPINPPICISVKKYAEKYFLSRYQIKRLLAKKILCAVKFKGHLFITDISPENK